MSYLIVLLSGILTTLPMVIPELWFISWFSAVPLFFIIKKKKSAYRHGLVFSMGYYGMIYYWFISLYPMDFAGFGAFESICVILLGWFGLSALQSVGTAFVPFICNRAHSFRPVINAFMAASVWTVFEWLQTQTWLGVPWGRIAVTQYSVLPVIQSASLLGSLFVGFLIILVNAFIAEALAVVISSGGFVGNLMMVKRLAYLIPAAAIFIANYVFGTVALAMYDDSSTEDISAAVIQGNISSLDKWADDSVTHSIEVYTELTETACIEYKPKIVVWPETVITTAVRTNESARDMISALSVRTGAVLLVGAYDYIYNDEIEDYNRYNAIVAFYPDGSICGQPYYKRHPVPFGEYLPMPGFFRAVLPVLANMNVFEHDLTAGEDINLLPSQYGDIGGLVCFDSIYETLTLDSVRGGAKLFALVTNDSWYKDYPAVYQHNGHAVLRAVESGRYFLRAANTGVSTVIKPTGEVIAELDPLVTGYTGANVKLLDTKTPYSVVGNIWVIACAVYTVIVFAAVSIRKLLMKAASKVSEKTN